MQLVGLPNSVKVAAELYVQSFSRCLASLAAVREQEALRLHAIGERGDFVYFDEIVETANHLATKAVQIEFGLEVLDVLKDMSVVTTRVGHRERA
jgi:hypothetical protein